MSPTRAKALLLAIVFAIEVLVLALDHLQAIEVREIDSDRADDGCYRGKNGGVGGRQIEGVLSDRLIHPNPNHQSERTASAIILRRIDVLTKFP